MLIRTRNGKTGNPSVRFAKQYRASMQKYDVELGLTSASRTRMPAASTKPAAKILDPIEAALCAGRPS